MLPPALDEDLGLFQRAEDLAVEEFVPELRVEAFDIAILPWAARGDVGGLCAYRPDPGLDSLGDELRTVV